MIGQIGPSPHTNDTDRQRVFTKVTLDTGNATKALVDTGAAVSIISWDMAVQEQLFIRLETDTHFVTVTGQPITIMGSVQINVTWGHMTRKVRFYVQHQSQHDMVIGDNMLRNFQATICYTAPQTVVYLGEFLTMHCSVVTTWSQSADVPDIAVIELAPRTKMYIPCALDTQLVDEGNQWIWMEPAPDTSKHIQRVTGETIIRINKHDRKAYIPVVNTTNKPIKIDDSQILLMGSKITQSSSLHRTLEAITIRDQDWTEWLTSGTIPDSAYPVGIKPAHTPTHKLTDLWQKVRQHRVQQVPASYFDYIDWSNTTVTPEQQSAMRTFICQSRHTIAKSRFDLGVHDILQHKSAQHIQDSIDGDIPCNCIIINCPAREGPHNETQQLDIEISRLVQAGLIISKARTSRQRHLIILYHNPHQPTQDTYHNLITSTCCEWANQKQNTEPQDFFELNDKLPYLEAIPPQTHMTEDYTKDEETPAQPEDTAYNMDQDTHQNTTLH